MKMIDKFREEHPTWELNVEAECPSEFGYVEHEDEECPCVSCEECWGREIKVKVTNDMLIRLRDRLETENCIIAPSEDGMSIWVKLDDEWSVRGGGRQLRWCGYTIIFFRKKKKLGRRNKQNNGR